MKAKRQNTRIKLSHLEICGSQLPENMPKACGRLIVFMPPEMKEMARDLLGSARARQRGHFNPKSVASLLQEHNRGVRDHAHPLWALLMLEIWRRMFIYQEPAASFRGAKGNGIKLVD
jgi:Asparagine synthase